MRRNSKSMRELCDGTGNTRVKSLLQKYEWVSDDTSQKSQLRSDQTLLELCLFHIT